MKAFVLEYGDQKMKEMEDPVAEQNEVVVSLRAAGLNRRDLYIPNRWGSEKEALILGSDGAGVVESVGQGVKRFKIGDEVILNPSLHWYENTDAPPSNFDIIGMPGHGTFAEKIVISEEQLEPKPAHLTWEEAGVLALSALTGYRAMFTKGNLKPGETVFIPGAGGGSGNLSYSVCKKYWCKSYCNFSRQRETTESKGIRRGYCNRYKQ